MVMGQLFISIVRICNVKYKLVITCMMLRGVAQCSTVVSGAQPVHTWGHVSGGDGAGGINDQWGTACTCA